MGFSKTKSKGKGSSGGSGDMERLALERDVLMADVYGRTLNMRDQDKIDAVESSKVLFTYEKGARVMRTAEFLDFVANRSEKDIIQLLATIDGDLGALLNYVQAENDLDAQFDRPAPRLQTTIRRFRNAKGANRLNVAMHSRSWTVVVQNLLAKIMGELTAAPQSTGIRDQQLMESLVNLQKRAQEKANALIAKESQQSLPPGGTPNA